MEKGWFIVLDCCWNRVDRPFSSFTYRDVAIENPIIYLEITIFLSLYPSLSGENSLVQKTTWLYHVASARSLFCLVRVICSSSFSTTWRRRQKCSEAHTERHSDDWFDILHLIPENGTLMSGRRRNGCKDCGQERGIGQRSMYPTCRAAAGVASIDSGCMFLIRILFQLTSCRIQNGSTMFLAHYQKRRSDRRRNRIPAGSNRRTKQSTNHL